MASKGEGGRGVRAFKAGNSRPRVDSFEDESLRSSVKRLVAINGHCSYGLFVSSGGARSNNTMRIKPSRPPTISI